MRELYRNPYLVLSIDEPAKLVTFYRTKEKIQDLDVMAKALEGLYEVLSLLDRSKLMLLVDLREGPLRSDDTFESASRGFQQKVFGGFSKIAILVRTAVGELQMNRQRREGNTVGRVFREEAEALAYLRSPQSLETSRG